MCDEASRKPRDDTAEESPYMQALLYLQTELAQVTDSTSQNDFLACMGYLLASDKPQPADIGTANNKEDMQSSSTIGQSKRTEIDVEKDRGRWCRRTEVFEQLLDFFPEDCVQPKDDLVSCTSAWESLL